MSFVIIQDTRERVGTWNFSIFPECEHQIIDTLKSGDYSLLGYETKIALERKKTILELSSNLVKYRKRFESELLRLQSYEVKYVVCEFTLSQLLIHNAKGQIKNKFSKISGKYLISVIEQLSQKYNIEFLFVESKEEAEQIAFQIFKEFYEQKIKHT